MGRFSPTVRPDPGTPFEDLLGRALDAVRQKKLDEEAAADRELALEDRSRRHELEDVALSEKGYRRFDEPPTRLETPPAAPPSRGMGTGPGGQFQPQGGEFAGVRLGTGTGGQFEREPENPLAARLAAARGTAMDEDGSDVIALPGQFIPGMGYAQRTIRTPDFNPYARGGDVGFRGRQAPTRSADPRYEQVAGSVYRDTEWEDPEVVAKREERMALAEALGRLDNLSDAEAAALVAGAPQGVVFRETPEDELEQFRRRETAQAKIRQQYPTMSERVAAGNLSLRQRELAQEESERAMEDYAELLLAHGSGSPEELSQVMRAQFPQDRQRAAAVFTRALEERRQQVSRGGTRGGDADPAYTERRKAIIDQIGSAPTTPETQTAVDLLAQGRTKEQVMAMLRQAGAPARVVQQVEDYLIMMGGE